ncbi:uncharacterized protein DUF2637 [Saccharopolyspora dendranthemae]|uniref:Uncharacterized protein DUF2637 n=2 Tax=Saccharopolyspora dendranthemae TaxID=1181886 RepID=A0A561V7I6_9PSEU|nr:uncharacterized protein DUF2637 [Saccharopolyspora dendranthemae]
MGWAASFAGLHEFGVISMTGFGCWTTWLVPATFDDTTFAGGRLRPHITWRTTVHRAYGINPRD